LTGSPGRPGQFFFFKSKRRRFSKKKNQRVFNRVLLGQPGRRVTTGFSFPYFFFNPAWFQPRVNPSGRVSKLWLLLCWY
jgi:hypothetical protein